MKIVLLALILALPIQLFADVDDCGLALAKRTGFVNTVICRGNFDDHISGKRVNFSAELNSHVEEDEDYLSTGHLTTAVSEGFWRKKSVSHFHHHWGSNCVENGHLVTCSGYGVGTGAVNFEVVVDLLTKTAIGFYSEFQPSTGRPTKHLEFKKSNPLKCFVGAGPDLVRPL